jgi:hypothetical protein
LTVFNVPGDGDCFFHAVADQLSTRYPEDFRNDHEHLRDLAASYMVRDYERFKPVIEAMEEGGASKYITKSFEKHAWADHPIIVALAEAMACTFVIIRNDGASPNTINPGASQILYLGYLVGSHYISLHGTPNALMARDLMLPITAVDDGLSPSIG